jgi:prepilin-type N-terminal cleavage/methylation domain-containing protein
MMARSRAVGRSRDGGFTLVEVLVALFLVGVFAGGTAALIATSLGSIRDAREETVAAALAIQKMEHLRSAAGAGVLVPSPDDALDVEAAGFADVVDASGRGVSANEGSPQSTVYLRRWRVRPRPDDSAGGWVLHVRVTTPRRDARRSTSSAVRPAGDVTVATACAVR